MDRAKENPKEGFDTPPLSLSPNQNCFNDHQSKCLEICVAILYCNELSVAYRKVKPVLWWILIFKLKQQLLVHIQCYILQRIAKEVLCVLCSTCAQCTPNTGNYTLCAVRSGLPNPYVTGSWGTCLCALLCAVRIWGKKQPIVSCCSR